MPDSSWIDSGANAPQKTSFEKALEWINHNRQTALGLIVLAAAAAVLILVFSYNASKTAQNAQKELFIAQQVAQGGRLDAGLKQLNEVENKYSSKPEADFAIYSKGDIYFAQGQYKEAAAEYEKILKRQNHRDLLPYAAYALAKTYQAMGDYDTAIIKLKDFIAAWSDHYLCGQAYISLAHIYSSKGDFNAAKEVYEKITVLFPDTGWAEQAKIKLSVLPNNQNKKK